MAEPQTPEWLVKANSEADFLDLQAVLPLDYESLVQHASMSTGLDDFGDNYWQEPLQILCKDLDSIAELTLFGRIAARSELLIWLENRLNILELIKNHPEITEQEITAPMFIVGLPRSGTSILSEVLAQDPDVGVPLTWESMFPYPPPETTSYQTDPRIHRANGIVPDASICDSHYYDLLEDPIANVQKIYAHFDVTLSDSAEDKMKQYLADKPQGKFGAHNYTSDVSERPFFKRYQEHYGVPSEV